MRCGRVAVGYLSTMTRRIVPATRARQAAAAAVLTILLAVLAALVGLPDPAGADEEILLAPDSVVRGEPGSVTTVATSDVPPEFVGSTCALEVVALNGSSTHVGNTLFVSTGDTRIEVPSIEDAPDGSVVADLSVVLGTSITLEIQFGDDGISSLGFSAGFDCPPAAPTVLPAQQLPEDEELPETPTADASHGQPAYTG